jgi:hypothetical protein
VPWQVGCSDWGVALNAIVPEHSIYLLYRRIDERIAAGRDTAG